MSNMLYVLRADLDFLLPYYICYQNSLSQMCTYFFFCNCRLAVMGKVLGIARSLSVSL